METRSPGRHRAGGCRRQDRVACLVSREAVGVLCEVTASFPSCGGLFAKALERAKPLDPGIRCEGRGRIPSQQRVQRADDAAVVSPAFRLHGRLEETVFVGQAALGQCLVGASTRRRTRRGRRLEARPGTCAARERAVGSGLRVWDACAVSTGADVLRAGGGPAGLRASSGRTALCEGGTTSPTSVATVRPAAFQRSAGSSSARKLIVRAPSLRSLKDAAGEPDVSEATQPATPAVVDGLESKCVSRVRYELWPLSRRPQGAEPPYPGAWHQAVAGVHRRSRRTRRPPGGLAPDDFW